MRALRKFIRVAGAFILAFVVLALVYYFFVRSWERNWGATRAEVDRSMPGDEIISKPNYVSTRGIMIKAKPEEIWPWLVQMGYKRGGLYSYDWLDRWQGILDRPSAIRVLEEYQSLKPGDVIPIGKNPGWPVSAVEPGQSLVLDINQQPVRITWSFGLRPLNEGTTRLVLRLRGLLKPKITMLPAMAFLDVAEFPMVRKMLTGIRDRVYQDPQLPDSELLELGTWGLALLFALITGVAAFFRLKWFRLLVISLVCFVAFVAMAYAQAPLFINGLVDLVLFLWMISAFGGFRRKAGLI